jgi:hypothetical protein
MVETITLTKTEFDELLDYSCSNPTGTTIGKRWKRRRDYHDETKGWDMGEYIEHPNPSLIGIKWREIIVELTEQEEQQMLLAELRDYLKERGIVAAPLTIQSQKVVVCFPGNMPEEFSLYDPDVFDKVYVFLSIAAAIDG